MKKLMVLALAGASILACGQANAATWVIETPGTWTKVETRYNPPGPDMVFTQTSTVPIIVTLDTVLGTGGFYLEFPGSKITYNVENVKIVGNDITLISRPSTLGALNLTLTFDHDLDRQYPTTAESLVGATLFGDVSSRSGSQVFSGGWGVPSAPVPEPATWGLMIAGFGIAGATLRRRKAVFSFA